MAKHEYRGEWFLPHSSDRRIPGILKINDGKILLTLYSRVDLNGNEVTLGSGSPYYKLILGQTGQGQITLFNVQYHGFNEIGGGLLSISLLPQTAFQNIHFSSHGEIMANRISCSYTYLDRWAEDMSDTSPFPPSNFPWNDFDNRAAKSIVIPLDDKFTVSIDRFLRKHPQVDRNKLAYEMCYRVDFISNTTEPFAEFEKRAIEFEKLMTLGINRPVRMQIDMAKVPQEKLPILIHQVKNSGHDDENKRPSSRSMLFSYRRLGEASFKDVVFRWFNTFREFGVVYTLYLDSLEWFPGAGVSFTPVMVTNRVLNIIQGLETYHARSTPESGESRQIFKEEFNKIRAKLTADEKRWLDRRTQPARIILKDRLLSLLERHANIFTGILDVEDAAKLADDLVEIRNSLSHGRNSDFFIDERGVEVYHLARLLLVSCILDILGIRREKIEELLELNIEFGPILFHYNKNKGL